MSSNNYNINSKQIANSCDISNKPNNKKCNNYKKTSTLESIKRNSLNRSSEDIDTKECIKISNIIGK